MYIAKFNIEPNDVELADYIKTQLGQECEVNVVNSRGIFGSEDIIISIISNAAGIAGVVAVIISNFLNCNKGKTVTIENSKGKRSYTGYSIKEIKELEDFIAVDVQEIVSED